MKDLSLHILDVVENSIEAGATRVEITIKENIRQNRLIVKIKDNGKGMDKKTLDKVLDPFYTTKKTRRIGLGLSMLAQAVKETQGDFTVKSKRGKGTTIIARFVYDHIDRKPLGDIAETLIALIASNGLTVDFIYKHEKNSKHFVLDTKDIKEELDGIPINNFEVLKLLQKNIRKELKSIE